jgi:hypothetical protein
VRQGKNKERFTPLKGEITRKNFLALDLESKDGSSQKKGLTRPFLAGIYDGSQCQIFSDQKRLGHWSEWYHNKGGCIDRMMRALLRKKYRGYHVYAHYGGKFDFLFLMPWLMGEGKKQGFKFRIIPVSSSIQVLDVWRGKNSYNKIRFLDSYKLIPTGLDKAAKSFGLEGKLEHDLDLHENDPHWIEYLQQDLVQLYQVVEKFHHYIESVLGGEVGITAPATSMKLFRRQYLKKALPRSMDTHDFVRESYVGGRVEPFRTHGEGISYFDINSSYPAAMLEDMPAGKATWWQGEPPKRLREKLGFCEVDVEVPTNLHIPPLPLKGHRKWNLPHGKLLFPVGRLRGIWEWGELQLALEMGCQIAQWHRSVWYERVPLFEGFVRDLYKYRDKSLDTYDEGLAAVVKIMLNSAYGKFGMKTMRKKIYLYDDPELPANAEPANGDPNSEIWYAEEESDACYVMPQIAARVTALARVRLYRYMQAAIKAGGNIYYCDTDSLMTDVREGIETSTQLGGLKDEYPDHSGKLKGVFLGPKLYMLTNDERQFQRVAAKGLQFQYGDKDTAQRRRQIERDTFERFGRGETLTSQRLEKVGTLAREQFARGPLVRDVPRTHLAGDTDGKRIIHLDGTTSPHQAWMW